MSDAPQAWEAYLARLAARTPTPGGGSAAGVAAALGAALGSMVLAYSGGRKGGDPETDAVLATVGKALQDMRSRLLLLADQDAEAYAAVRAARALPRETKKQAAEREARLQEALLRAAEVPLRTATLCRECLESLAGLADRTNPHLATDLGGAAVLLGAAAELAGFNVRINLAALKDLERRSELQGRLESVSGRCAKLASDLRQGVEQGLGG